jgi:integrating conjugative element protein (TIGR03755 family)
MLVRFLASGIRVVQFALATVLLMLAADMPATNYAPARNSDWYYEIGGAKAISAAANAQAQSVTLNASLDLSHIYSCGNFDPVGGITNILNNLEGQVMKIYQGAINAVTSAIASLPAYILQRASPGLYDLYQNAVLRAEAVLSLANKSCEEMEAQIRNGQNPYEHFLNYAKFFDWKVQMGNGGTRSSSTDVNNAKTTVESNNGQNGIPWLGGTYAGGSLQRPVSSITDTVLAGYNIELNRPVTTTSAAPNGSNASGLAKIWKSPSEAQNFARQVVGDVSYNTSKTNARQSLPGHGLLPRIEQDRDPIVKALRDTVSGSQKPNSAQLDQLSAFGIQMTRPLIDAVRTLPTPQERETAIQKLAEETATARNLERALMLRRLLQSGRMEPNIYGSPVGPDIDRAMETLNLAIDNILYETSIRREMMSQTAGVLLGRNRERIETGDALQPVTPKDPGEVTGGAVSK